MSDQQVNNFSTRSNKKPFRVSSFDRLNLDECEALALRSILHAAKGDITAAAERLGLDELTLLEKIQHYSLCQ